MERKPTGMYKDLKSLEGEKIKEVKKIDTDIIVEMSSGSSFVIGEKAKSNIDILILEGD